MSRFWSRGAPALALVLLSTAFRASADEPLTPTSPCAVKRGDVVEVIVQNHELWLCEQGTAVAAFPVALGQGGIDKHRKGDGRTPLGTYTLGTPRTSTQFGVFIPIEYPTRGQAARGFTGGAVGIHGPPRGLTEPDYPTAGVDWTEGCIATGVDADIEVIAEFVRARKPLIVIR